MDLNITLSSDNFSALSQAEVQRSNDVFLSQYTLVAVTTLSVYEAILMFPEELEYIYTKKITLTSFLYWLARYCTIGVFFVEGVMNFLSSYYPTFFGDGLAGELLLAVVGLLALIGIQGLWGLRFYAVSGGNKSWTITLIVIFLLIAGIDIACLITSNNGSSTTGSERTIVTRVLFTSQNALLTLYNTMIFVGTVYYTIGSWRLRRQISLDSTNSITKILLEQGTAKYIVLLLSTVATIVLDLLPISVVLGSLGAYLQNSLSAILLCRLTLDLRCRYGERIDAVEIPTLTWSVRSVRDTGRYIRESIVAEGGGIQENNASFFMRLESEDVHDIRIPSSDSYRMV